MKNLINANRLYWLLISLLLAALTSGIIYGLMHRPAPTNIQVLPPPPTALPTPAPTQGPLRVYVSGAVAAPDVYTLPPGSTVQQAIESAGGSLAEANLDAVNLSQVVQDQAHVHVPQIGQGSAPAAGAESSSSGALVNINTANSEELQTLPGIGPAMAQRIIDYRQENGAFESIEELVNVKGIGAATLEKLQNFVSIGP